MNQFKQRDEIIMLMAEAAKLMKQEKRDGVIRQQTNDKLKELYVYLHKLYGD